MFISHLEGSVCMAVTEKDRSRLIEWIQREKQVAEIGNSDTARNLAKENIANLETLLVMISELLGDRK